MELLGWSAVVFLAALGLLELVRMAVFWMLRPQRPHRGALVVIPESGEDCEQLIRSGMARLRWMDWPDCNLVCLNRDDDPQVEAIARILERRYPQLRLSKPGNLVYDILENET